jgi:hypothetical protein
MDRGFVYQGEIPLDTDVLQANLRPYISIAKLSDAVLGKTQILNNFACTPTSPATMTVNVGYGEIYSLQNVDTSSYGSISSNSNQIVKQGITFNTTNLSCPAPVGSGTSINYLIEISFTETDIGSTVLSYYNSSNINAPLSGPGGNGQPQNTIRQDGVTITVKAGTAAPTGTQTTPNPDTGYTGAYVVTVAYGQTTITSGNISVYSSASFINETLTQKVSQPTGDLRWAQISRVQSNYYNFSQDTGSSNAYVATLTPAIASYSQGLLFSVLIANTNTGSSTINVNGLGTKTIKLTNGNNVSSGDLLANMIAWFEYDGTNIQLLNPPRLVTATQIQDSALTYAADTGSANAYVASISPTPTAYVAGMQVSIKIANTNTGASTLNLNSLGTETITLPNGTGLIANSLVSGQIAIFEFDGTNFQLLNSASPISQAQIQNCSFTYGADTGSANSYATSLSPAPASYTTGMQFSVKISNTNTAASTFNLNSLGSKNIKLTSGSAINPSDLLSGMIAIFEYDGTNLQLLNPASWASQSQIQNGTLVYAADSGSANSYAANISPAISGYITGMEFRIKISNTNTGASTLNLNSLGTKNIKLTNGSAINPNDIISGMIAYFAYDGTNMQLLNPASWASQYQVQSGGIIYAASISSANTYTASLSPAPISYTTGMSVRINFTNTNTGVATLNLNSLGAKSIKRDDGSSLVAGDIPASTILDLIYDGTNFRLTGLKNWQFGSSLSSNGYQKLPSGLIIQWFIAGFPVVVNGTISTQTINFPLAFPNTVFSVVGSFNQSSGVSRGVCVNTYSYSASNFMADLTAIAAQPFAANETINSSFIAIGY